MEEEEKEFLYELMAEFEKRDIHELSFEKEELSIHLAKAPKTALPSSVNQGLNYGNHVNQGVLGNPANVAGNSVSAQTGGTASPATELVIDCAAEGAASGAELIRAPAVGTFYRQPAPDAPNFVSEGDTVKKGQTICILEAMKLMNELQAEFDCEIVKVLVDNGTMVAYNDALFEVKRI